MKIYLVGGAVRDIHLGLEPKDRDYVVVGSSVEEMESLGFEQVGKDFPVFMHQETREEYALARTERKSGLGYSYFICETKDISLEEDLKRRDITINSMAIDLETNELIDPFNGLVDLKNKVIRHTSKFFIEDPLRVLRVARFHANYKFTIDLSTFKLMRSIPMEDFSKINKERIYKELTKLEGINDVKPFFKILKDLGLLTLYFPEIKFNELDFSLHSHIVENHSKDIDSFIPALLHKGNLDQMDIRNFITKKQIKRAKLINIVYNKELSTYEKVHFIVKERLLTESLDTIKFVEFCGKLDLTKEINAVKLTTFNQEEMKLVSDKLEYRIQAILKNIN